MSETPGAKRPAPRTYSALQSNIVDDVEADRCVLQNAFIGRMFLQALANVKAKEGLSSYEEVALTTAFNEASSSVVASQKTGIALRGSCPPSNPTLYPVFQRTVGHSTIVVENADLTLVDEHRNKQVVYHTQADLLRVESIPVKDMRRERRISKRQKTRESGVRHVSHEVLTEQAELLLEGVGLDDDAFDDDLDDEFGFM
ncbi:hypothetical protein DIPPA_07136 [Diplonema papillatum]|nr:hypothetical protein DIPPA_07136 [Diplonema papillatum]